MKSTSNKPLADQLRAAIVAAERRGMTQYQIAKAAGVFQSQITRLMAGDVSPRLDTAEAIAKALGLELKLAKRRR
ncbi:MAG: helix-turn-helix domain-containing protein [Planctomycetes bacterium]|nr:helix-turn-helix domain-containing protein [Planctomycetota bacterium]